MFPKRFISNSDSDSGIWEELERGAPTIMGFARLCANCIAADVCEPEGLSIEARAILFAASDRGVIEIKSSSSAFDSVDRFLAVCVETQLDEGIVFRDRSQPHRTIEFLDAFRELCAHGLVIHHLLDEFSLSGEGFRLATSIDEEEVQESLEFGSKLARHEW